MFEKIIDSFEKLCVQIIIEIILVPITIYRLYQKSSRCYDYAVLEMEKEDALRFQDFLSPIKLSVYTSVIISLVMIDFGGQASFIAKISGLNMVEKALIIFMLNNFTAIIFSLFLLRYKQQRVNSPEFKTLLFSFIYASIYTTVPQFLLVLSMMVIGQSINITQLITDITATATYHNIKLLLIGLVSIISYALLLFGLVKQYKAYRYILKENLPYTSAKVHLFTLLFFSIQLFYIMYVVEA